MTTQANALTSHPIATLDDVPLNGRRVFVRLDLNAPTEDGKVTDATRLTAVLPTLEKLRAEGSRIIIGSHFGRPKGKTDPELSLETVGAHLAGLLDTEVRLTDEPAGDGARKLIGDLREGQIVLLENLRFHPGEESNAPAFAKELASYADVYVNDAFGAAHRGHASTVGMVPFVPYACAGLLMAAEIRALSTLLADVRTPYLAIVGGAKVSGKIDVLDALLGRVDDLIIGGAMANTFLLAMGKPVGKSLVEEDKAAVARNFLRKAKERKIAVHLPSDVVVAKDINDAKGQALGADDVLDDQCIFDIGPKTREVFGRIVSAAKTIFWNGPMGVFEKEAFASGTLHIANAIAQNNDSFSVVGGGDSVAAASMAGVFDKISHISTGGGASLEFVQGRKLPGITALEKATVAQTAQAAQAAQAAADQARADGE